MCLQCWTLFILLYKFTVVNLSEKAIRRIDNLNLFVSKTGKLANWRLILCRNAESTTVLGERLAAKCLRPCGGWVPEGVAPLAGGLTIDMVNSISWHFVALSVKFTSHCLK